VESQSVRVGVQTLAAEQKQINNSRNSEIGGEKSRKKSRNASARSRAVRDAAAEAVIGGILVAQLNAAWRVIDDGRQWVLERRPVDALADETDWRTRTRVSIAHNLLSCVRRFCGDDADPAALAILAALPAEYRLKRRRGSPAQGARP
jgi:hypothetical protein